MPAAAETIDLIVTAATWDERVARLRQIPQRHGTGEHAAIYAQVARQLYVPHLAPDYAYVNAAGLPVAWQVQTAKDSEIPEVPDLLDSAVERGFAPGVAILDRGYDTQALYELLEGRDIRPVIPLRNTPAVKRGEHLPPSCDHGTWIFKGSDTKRGASKWRCPAGKCKPASVWIKADRLHPLIPRGTARYKGLYHQRGAVEREFGHLKHQWAMLPLRVRRIYRVRLHVDLTILAQLASALLVTRTP